MIPSKASARSWWQAAMLSIQNVLRLSLPASPEVVIHSFHESIMKEH
jgi:hypothetical protein